MTTHIEEFAGRLRGLKERSGHSYGMLAARLHVSTSTLHRYCNGAAVPGDYAPVERFARQCGASAEELVALHRCWLLADAVRRREPDRAPATAARSSTPPGLPEAPARPGPPARSQAPGRTDGPAPCEPPAASEAPARPVTPAPCEATARPGAPDLPKAPDTSNAPDAQEPADMPEEPDLPDVADAPAAPPARGGRPARLPRRTGIALAAAAALLAALLPLVLRGGHGDGDGAHAPTALPHPPSTATRPPASASASGRKGASTAPGTAAGPVGPAPSTGPAGPPGSAAPPVQVTVLSDNWDTQCDQWFLLRQQPARVPPPPSLQQTNAWGAALGGTPAQDLRLQLTAQSLPGEPVVLHALYVKVVGSAAAPKGNGYTPGSGCGGGLAPASFAVDLDAAVPRARPVSGSVGQGEERGTADFPFQVSAGDAQVLDVDAHTLDHDVSWYLDLVWSRGDRQGTLRVDDHGAPFRTVGLKGDPTYFYDGVKWSSASPVTPD